MGCCNNGFGGGGCLWIIVLIIILCCCWEQLGRKRLRQWLRLQQRLRRLLLTEHDIRRRGPSERSCLGRAEGTESH